MRSAGVLQRRSTRVRIAGATILAAAAGVGVGTALAGDPPARQADPAPPRVGLRSGVARLPLPAGWVPLDRHSSLPGLQEATAVRGPHSMIALDIRSPENPSLLPAKAASAQLPTPQLVRLGARRTWRYEIPETRVVAMALPTTGGVVTIACQGGATSTGARDDCSAAMSALRLDGAAALTPAPETAARIVLPDVMAALNRQRLTDRRALAATRSPERRGAAAQRLAVAYRNAAERLRPLAAGDAGALPGAFADLAREHLALAAASRRREVVAARRAGAAIEKGERRVQDLLAAVGAHQRGAAGE